MSTDEAAKFGVVRFVVSLNYLKCEMGREQLASVADQQTVVHFAQVLGIAT